MPAPEDPASRPADDTPIRPAATLMPVRDAPSGRGLEVCLLRRNANSTWVAGLALFPGGAVEARDGHDEMAARCRLGGDAHADGVPAQGRTDDVAARLGSTLAGGLAPWVAALRETYEEIGLLLATDPAGDWAHADPARAERLAAARADADGGRRSFAALLAEEALELRVDLLRFFAHWVTPPRQARRYDTRFYLAPTPADAPVRPDGTEIVAANWLVPADAIAAHEAGTLPMLPPTLGALHWLAPHADVGAAVAAADALGDIPRWTPGDIREARHTATADTERGTGAEPPTPPTTPPST